MAVEQKQGAKLSGPTGTDVGVQKTRNTLQETIVELKKTTWPTTQEANRITLVVVGVIVVLGFYMGALDYILSLLVNRFSLIK